MTVSSGPDSEGLREFLELTDRQLSPFFVGRNRQLDDIERAVAQVGRRQRQNHPEPAEGGLTRLIQAAPGAGKSSILYTLKDRWRKRGGQAPAVITMNGYQLGNWDVLRTGLAQALPESLGKRIFRILVPDRISSDVAEWDMPELPGSRPDRTVCLMVDEVQTVRTGADGGTDPEIGEFLLNLHSGEHGLPVIPVYAGLSHARQRLSEAGLSRLSRGTVHTLPPLSEEEARTSAAMFVERFRIATGTGLDRDWCRRVAAVSRGWPAHLHNGLQILAEHLLAAGSDLTRIDPEAWQRDEKVYRDSYYSARLSDPLAETVPLLADVTVRIGRLDHCDRGDALDIIQARADVPGPRRTVPAGMTVSGYLNEMLVCGVLQEDQGRLYCPIPSFRDYLVEQAARPAVLPEDLRTR